MRIGLLHMSTLLSGRGNIHTLEVDLRKFQGSTYPGPGHYDVVKDKMRASLEALAIVENGGEEC